MTHHVLGMALLAACASRLQGLVVSRRLITGSRIRVDWRLALGAATMLLCIAPAWSLSQWNLADSYPLEESWRWIRFGESAGLPSTRVTDILDAPDGTPWAVTEGGVAWYDGYRWRRVRADLPQDDRDVRRPFGFYKGKLILRCSGRICLVGKDSMEILPACNVERASVLLHDTLLLFVGNRIVRYVNDGMDTIDVPPGYEAELKSTTNTDGRGRLYYHSWNTYQRWSRETYEPLLDAGRNRLGAERMAINNLGQGCVVIKHPRRMRGIWEWDSTGPAHRASPRSTLSPSILDVSRLGDAIVIYEENRYAARFDGRWTPVRKLPLEFRGVHRTRFRPNGDLWLATDNGLYLCRLSVMSARSCVWPDEDDRNRVNDILRDRSGNVWCATSGGVVCIAPDGSQRTWTTILGKPFHIVTGVIEDERGRIWICSGADFTGVYSWDGHAWSHHATRCNGEEALIHRMYHGRSGRIWLAGHAPDGRMQSERNPGAFLLEEGRIRPWEQNGGLSHRRVYAVCEDARGAVWFGTYRGLCRWYHGAWTYFDREKTPGSLYVVSITAHTDGTVYFGTQYSNKRGVGRIDPRDRLTYITDAAGLGGATVNELRSDTHGRLWVTTDNGLHCLQEGRWTHYGKEAGLQGTKLWPAYPSGDSIYVGTAAMGWAVIDTRTLHSSTVRIDMETPVVEGRQVAVSWTPLVHWGAVAPERVFCRYRLDDDTWSAWSRISNLHLSDVAYGQHQVHVQAMGPAGQYEEAGAVALFSVPLPPILRWYILIPILLLSCVLIALTIVYTLRRRVHIREIIESRDRLKALAEELVQTEEHERRRLAQFLHDVIGQSLSLSYLNLHRWQKQECPDDSRLTEIRGMLDQIIRDTHTLTFDLCPPFMYELSLNEALHWIVDRIEQQHDHPIEKSLPGEPVFVQRELQVLLFMGARELLVNSIKHAQADCIRLELERGDGEILLRVTDDGSGFPAVDQAGGNGHQSGFGLYNMRRRLADFGVGLHIRSTQEDGTCVTIHVPASLLQHGAVSDRRNNPVFELQQVDTKEES